MPQIVDKAAWGPGQCLFSQDIEGPWVDTGVRVPWVNPYGYVSVRYWRDVARELLGMVPVEEVQGLRERVEAMGEEIARLQEIVDTEKKLAELREGAGI